MAKKKPNTQTHTQKSQNNIHYHHQPMDAAASEKLDSLKSLNAMLLKETVERRQQVDSLVQSIGALESELNRSVMENDSLKLKLNEFGEREVALEIENELVNVFVSVRVNELAGVVKERIEGLESNLIRVLDEKSEIEKVKSEREFDIFDLNRRLGEVMDEIDELRVDYSRVCGEKDDVRAQLDVEIGEGNGLRLKLIEAEKRETGILSEVSELKVKYDGLVVEKVEIEKRLELVLREKDEIERNLVESNGIVDKLKREIVELVKQKKGIEEEKNIQERKNDELQILVGELKDLVRSMRIEEGVLLEKVAGLAKKCVESSENEVKMRLEIDRLVEEKKETEEHIRSLVEELGMVTKDLEDALKVSDHQKLTIEQIIQEKTEMEDAKILGECEIVTMKEQLDESKSMVLSLEKSTMDRTEKLKQLEAEINHYRAAFDQATKEGNDARESLDEEKTIRNDLQAKILKIEKEIEDLREEFVKTTSENTKHLQDKKELEDRCAALAKDIDFAKTKFAQTQKEFDDTKAKVGLFKANLKMVLSILKKWDETTVLFQENGIEEGIKDHVREVGAIKRAFKDKDSRIEEMNRQIELLKSTVAEVHKGKSFWALVSSGTTLLAAAASVAYVVRGH